MEPANRNDDALRLSRFLAESLDIDPGKIPEPGEWAGTGSTIGALALRAGLLSTQQVDEIVAQQQRSGGLFGKIGVELGHLLEQQILLLLELQRFCHYLDHAAPLFLEGRLDLPRLLELLAEFVRREQNGDEPNRGGIASEGIAGGGNQA